MLLLLCCLCVFLQMSHCMSVEVSSATVSQSDTANNSEIRCYCNLAECITTSYMCKSEGLGCFSDIIAFSDVNKASHGCLDLLPRDRQDQCQNEPSRHQPPSPARSLLLCCYQDLCNHVDSPDTRQRFNDSLLASSLVTDADRGSVSVHSRLKQHAGYTSAEVWFRAATIAVPICGALILLVLIALAVKILQSDAMDERMLAAKLRSKHSGFSPVNLNGPSFVHHESSGSLLGKKAPLLFHHDTSNLTFPSTVPSVNCVNRPANHGQGVNILHSCQQRQKNEANAKLNISQNAVESSVPVVPIAPVHGTRDRPDTPTGLIDLHKSTSPCNNNCNIYHHDELADDSHSACALLSSATSTNKLTYKKPLVINWTGADVRMPNSQ